MSEFTLKYRNSLFAICIGSFATACGSTACEPVEPYSDEFALAPTNGDGGVSASAATSDDHEVAGIRKRPRLSEGVASAARADDQGAEAQSGRLSAVNLIALINLHASVHEIYDQLSARIATPRFSLVEALAQLNSAPTFVKSYDAETKMMTRSAPSAYGFEQSDLEKRARLVAPSLFAKVLPDYFAPDVLPGLRSSLYEMTKLIETAVTSHDEVDRFARIVTNLLRLLGVDRHDDVAPVAIELQIFADATVESEPSDSGRSSEFVPAFLLGVGTAARPVQFVDDDVEVDLAHSYFGPGGGSYLSSEWNTRVKRGKFNSIPLLFLRRLEQHSSRDDLTISRVRQDGLGLKIELPSDVRQGIVRYLSNDIRATRNAFDFVSEVALTMPSYRHGDPARPRFEFLLSENEFQPGDVVALLSLDQVTKTPVPVHYALALGDGLYLSKMGTGKRLGVTRLASALAGYGAQNFARVNLDSPEAIAEMFAALVR